MTEATAWGLDLGLPDLSGFRLWNVEVFNWGTFDGHVTRFPVHGHNMFVTGQVGAGKSTLVDALTTLFVQPHKVIYNQAAGAGRRERTLDTYVRGTYSTAEDDTGTTSKPVSLRGTGHVSVVLAHFRDDLSGTDATFAQVFYFTASGVEKVFAVADDAVTIADLLDGSATTIRAMKATLKRRMREQGSWKEYITAVRKRLGLQHERALALWAQTVSMKQVGNLTAFVRSHMLEPPDATWDKIEHLVAHYKDLTRAADAITTAKAKLAVLGPVVEALDDAAAARSEQEWWTGLRDQHLPGYFDRAEMAVLDAEIEQVTIRLREAAARRDAADTHRAQAATQVETLTQTIRDSGGAALQRLEEQVDAADDTYQRRRERRAQYAQRCAAAGIDPVDTLDEFTAQQARLRSVLDGNDDAGLQSAFVDASGRARDLRRDAGQVDAEIASLQRRRSNIDSRLLDVRAGIAAAAGVDDTDLPFAGELLRVAPEQSRWEPAVQRLMTGFGATLLVPEALLGRVSGYVDRHNLRTRLVFTPVPATVHRSTKAADGTVAAVVQVQPTHPMADWLAGEVARRFRHTLAGDPAALRESEQGITVHGQVKHRGGRYEKDDRHGLGDASRYVLGWDNQAKVAALRDRLTTLHTELAVAVEEADTAARAWQQARDRRAAVDTLLGEYGDFSDVDVDGAQRVYDDLAEQLHALKQASPDLEALAERRDRHQADVARHQRKVTEEDQRIGRAQEREETLRARRAALPDDPPDVPDDADEQLRALHAHAEQHLDVTLTVATVDRVRTRTRELVQDQIENRGEKVARAVRRAESGMQRYISTPGWSADTADADATLDSAADFRALHTRLRTDDLPRYEQAFRRQLSDNAIREMAGFHRHLDDAAARIDDHVDRINTALADIKFTDSTYIRLEAKKALDPDIRDFRRDLRDCIDGTLSGGDDAFTYERFLQVKAIMERFEGRDGRSEEDRRWTRRVTDVNNWFVFAIVERDLDTDQQVAYYADSDAKSGGEKERLAYTVLAAALAYNLGLVAGDPRSKTFRFVVIDEAFGKGSDSSTRYALDLFDKLGLQVLVVTPLQKKEVILPHVQRVALITRDGPRSRSLFMTIEEYRAAGARLAAALQAAEPDPAAVDVA